MPDSIQTTALDTIKELAADLKTVIDKAEARQYFDSQFEGMDVIKLLKLIARKDKPALGYMMRNYYQFVVSLFTRYGWADADAEEMTSAKLMQGITSVMATARQPKSGEAARRALSQKIVDMRTSGMRFKEIAGLLDMSVRAVSQRFHYNADESYRESMLESQVRYRKNRLANLRNRAFAAVASADAAMKIKRPVAAVTVEHGIKSKA